MTVNIKSYVDGPHIHGSLYRDQAIFDLEIERIWKKVWVYIGHESQIPNQGDFVRTQIFRQPLILSRGRDSQIRVFFNRCRHRANLVCFEQRGNCDAFVCPYHGWSFSTSGALLEPTFEEGYDSNLNKDDFALSEAPRVGSYRGLLFASLAPEGISLEEHLGQSREFIDLIADLSPSGQMRLDAGSQKVKYKGNWKYMPENSMEGDYHGPFLHRIAFDLFEEQTGFDVGSLHDNEVPDVIQSLPGGHMVEDYRGGTIAPPPAPPSEARLKYIRQMEKSHGPEKASSLLNAIAPLIYVFPNLMYVMTHFRHIVPIAPGESIVHYTPHLLDGVPDEINTGRLRLHEFMFGAAGFVSPDDIEIMERNQVGLQVEADDWLFIGRGAHRERVLPDGGTRGYTMDENHLRGFWRHYAEVMSA